MKRTILGGILVLIPMAVVVIVLGKAFQISKSIAEPVSQIIPIERVAGIAFVNLLAILLIILLCYLVGWGAQKGLIGSKAKRLDGLMMDVLPGYAVTKGMIASMAEHEDQANQPIPVVVHFDDNSQMAFEMARDEGRVVVFLPGAPSAWSGSIVLVRPDQVEALNIPMHQASRMLKGYGRSMLSGLPADLRPKDPPTKA